MTVAFSTLIEPCGERFGEMIRLHTKAGFKTAFVPRPLETGPGGKVDIAADASIDVFAASLVDLARLAGV